MLKQFKEGCLRFEIDVTDSCAQRIFEILKEEELKKGRWAKEKKDISLAQWVFESFGETQTGVDYIAKAKGER